MPGIRLYDAIINFDKCKPAPNSIIHVPLLGEKNQADCIKVDAVESVRVCAAAGDEGKRARKKRARLTFDGLSTKSGSCDARLAMAAALRAGQAKSRTQCIWHTASVELVSNVSRHQASRNNICSWSARRPHRHRISYTFIFM